MTYVQGRPADRQPHRRARVGTPPGRGGGRQRHQLETTRVPPRDKPYVLNVEPARFRLMKVMQKQEDWNLFDFLRADKYTAVPER